MINKKFCFLLLWYFVAGVFVVVFFFFVLWSTLFLLFHSKAVQTLTFTSFSIRKHDVLLFCFQRVFKSIVL